MSRWRTGLALGALLPLVLANGEGLAATGAPSVARSVVPSVAANPARSPAPLSLAGTARDADPASIASEQKGAVAARQTLGLGAREKLTVKDVVTDADGSTHVRYDRTFDGLRVIGGDLVSHRDRSGKIKSVSWNGAHRMTLASTKPKVTLSSARAIGRRRASLVQRTTSATKAELVVYAGGASGKAGPKLAYDVLAEGVRADQTPSKLHTILDANTGGTLTSFDEIENAVGHGFYDGTVSIATTAGNLPLMQDAVGNAATDLNQKTLGRGATFTDLNNNWGNGPAEVRARAGVDAQYGAQKAFAYFKSVLGRNGIRGNGAGARSRVHYGMSYQNAFWDGSQMTYGDGAGNARPFTELDIAGHEMAHGITETTAGLVEDGEAGGLNEATSDIFGTSVEWYAANGADVPDYLIGEKINFYGNGTPLRYLDRPSRDGRSRDCWSGSLGALDPHYSSGPLGHWFYLASEGSGAKRLNGVSYNSPTCNASKVTGIGRAAAAKIWYRTLTTYLTSSSGYAAAREGAIQSAKDLYGATSPACKAMEASFSAIGVRAGAGACSTAPAPLSVGQNLLHNPGFETGTYFWAGPSGIIAKNKTGQTARTGTSSAKLGGFGSSHSHSISQMVTIPAGRSVSLSYYVHIATTERAGSPVFDTMTVRAGSKVLQTLSNRDAASGFQRKTVDLTSYAGKTISLAFSGAEDAELSTSFVLDDLALVTSTAPGAPKLVWASPGNAQAALSWTAPVSNGGSAITKYTVTSTPGGGTATTTGATTVMVTGLVNGTSYTFKVTAGNAVGVSPASLASAAVTPRRVPGAPTGVLATATNAGAVVSWTAPVNEGGSVVTGYTVTATPGALTPPMTIKAAAGRTVTFSGLANGTSYTFRVTAANAAGSSISSTPSQPVTPRTVPGEPTGVAAVAGDTEAAVSWTAPAGDGGSAITGYTVTSEPGGFTAEADGATTATTVTGLTNGTAYTFTVIATNAAGTSSPSSASEPVTPVTPIAVPGAPTEVVATAGDAEAVITWVAPLSDGGSAITGYTVTAVPDGATVTTTGATTATIAGLTNGTSYTFTVTATNAVGMSAASSASNAVTPAVAAPEVPIT